MEGKSLPVSMEDDRRREKRAPMVPPPPEDRAPRIRMAETAFRRRAIWLADEFAPRRARLSKNDDRAEPILRVGDARYRFADGFMPVGAKLYSRTLSLDPK
eukprot:11335493-Alexandrium_andersonii.AAC.1